MYLGFENVYIISTADDYSWYLDMYVPLMS